MTLTACLSLWLLSVATALGYFDAPINFAWTAIKRAGTRTVATWGRATKRHATDSNTPPESVAPSFKDNPNYLEWSWPR